MTGSSSRLPPCRGLSGGEALGILLHVCLKALAVDPDRPAHLAVFDLPGGDQLPQRRSLEPHHLLGLLVGEPLPYYLRLHLSSLRLRLLLLVSIVVIL